MTQPSAHQLPGQILARGVCRALAGHDFAALTEFVPAPGLRVDVMALGPRGEVWVVECKSGRADYARDAKWQAYLDWCDRYFWAVSPDFPVDLLPEDTGLMLADGFDAEILRMPAERKLAPARRAAVVRAFARTAARQVQGFRDPGFSAWA
ncbi:MAG: MmcB family DNA repair protein [Gemmobacter sp.]